MIVSDLLFPCLPVSMILQNNKNSIYNHQCGWSCEAVRVFARRPVTADVLRRRALLVPTFTARRPQLALCVVCDAKKAKLTIPQTYCMLPDRDQAFLTHSVSQDCPGTLNKGHFWV